MASNDQQQMGEFVPMHKRMAMGEKLNGQSLKGSGTPAKPEPKQGGLAQAKKK